jgi:ATP-binding cassette subfamily F protein uup
VIAGEVVVGKNTRAAYLDQARAGLDDALSVFDEVRGEGGGTTVSLGPGRDSMDLRSYLELFLFDGHAQRQKVGSLSGGERARVALAKVLREGANLLFFDEPTNDLDLATLGAFEDLLLSFEGSAIVVTHDRALLDRVATAILAFEPPSDPPGPAKVTRYAGGYQDYLSQRGQGAPSSVAPSVRSPSSPAPAPPAKAKPKGLTYAERIELENVVPAIDVAERKVAEIEALLADPSLYAARGHEVGGLQARLAAARLEAATLVARWEELETKKAGG